jgi:uncharacterized protein (DUF302 family)
MRYGYTKEIKKDFEEAVNVAKEALKKEGFGVLTEIDVKATLKKKLNVDYKNYLILGACNPSFAYKALQAEKEIGLLLPCNIIVYKNDDKVFVSALLPTVAMSMVDNEQLKQVAQEVEQKLKEVVDNIP